MYRQLTCLFLGIAALALIATTADARDGCGRGWYYNGFRCVPERDRFGPPPDRGPFFMFDFDDRNEPRYFRPSLRRYPRNNGCPRGYTVQDGLCKPYSGR